MRRRRVLAALTSATAASTAGCLESGYRLAERSLLDDPPSLAWEHDATDVVAVDGDAERVVLATEDRLAVHAKDDGETVWRHATGSAVGLESDDRRVYSYGGHGVLAVDAESGTERWRARGDFRTLHRGASALVCDPARGRETVGLDPETGARRWTWEGNMVYTVAPEFGLVPGDEYRALDLADGTVRWRFDAGDRGMPVATTDDRVVFAIREDATSALVCLDAETGTERWRVETSADGSWNGGFVDGALYATRRSAEGATRLYGVDASSGERLWAADLDAEVSPSTLRPVAVVDDTIFLNAGWRRSLPTSCGVDRTDGTIVHAETEHGFVRATDDLAVFATDDGNFVGVGADGSTEWEETMQIVPRVGTAHTDGPVYTPPQVRTLEEWTVAGFRGVNSFEVWNHEIGDRRWRVRLEETLRELFATRDGVYAATSDRLYAFPDL